MMKSSTESFVLKKETLKPCWLLSQRDWRILPPIPGTSVHPLDIQESSGMEEPSQVPGKLTLIADTREGLRGSAAISRRMN